METGLKRYLKRTILSGTTCKLHLSKPSSPTQGFETTLRVPIELEKVYINMKAQIHTHEVELTLKDRKKFEARNKKKNLTSLDKKAAFDASERHKVKDMVILGYPGFGKATLLKYILVLLIEGKGSKRLGIQNRLVPFFAP